MLFTFDAEMEMATGEGFVSPGAAVGVEPGVMVTAHVPAGGRDTAHVDAMDVPAGKGVSAVTATFNAAALPVLVTSKLRGLPVKAAFPAGSFTLSASDATLT